MTPREKWVAALRSGDYAQTQGALRAGDAYCCLGVACDLYGEEHGVDWKDPGNEFLGSNAILPLEVMDWLGLEERSGIFDVVDPVNNETHAESLSALNDTGATFEQIADLIESEPPRLFK